MHIANIGRIRKHLTTDATKTLIHSLVTSRIDYGNALMNAAPSQEIQKLQRVQNSCARLITRTPRRAHISPIIHDLHWLPVEKRIQYKQLLHTYRCFNNSSPKYLADLLLPYNPSRNLRSKDKTLLAMPKTYTTRYGRRFEVTAARLWNTLPENIKTAGSLQIFKKKLKTFLFR